MGADVEVDSIGVLDRMTAILEAFDEDDRGLHISELALRAGLPKSTVSRLVSTLVRQHYLERDGRVIHLGLRLFELGQLAEAPRELRGAALPIMADLRNRTGQTVQLAISDAHEMVCIAVMRAHSGVPIAPRVGARSPADASTLGRAVLAYSTPADVEATIAVSRGPSAPRTLQERERFLRELEGIRLTGFASEVGETAGDVSSAASPVFSSSDGPVAAISVTARACEFDLQRSASSVRAAALALTRRISSSRWTAT